MMNNTEYKGERLSFIKLFSQKHYKLVIPIIQRDYAQGRNNDATVEVRNDFLDALYKYLDENKPNRDLDFVYGTLQNVEGENRVHFIPLDGQQRLTTLFLLHWFLSQISTNDVDKRKFKENLLEGSKSQFTYETRQSSTDFCNVLMQSDISMGQLCHEDEKDENSPVSLSKTIENQSWFFRSWQSDPTVQSMLVMLDAIYHKFNQHPEFFERLMDEDEPIVTFIFMNLKEYKLTDDLYIKMNSRGKALSHFENFKAKFEQYIKQLLSKDSELAKRNYTLKFASSEKQVDLHDYFAYNIDTKWTNLCWQYCKDESAKENLEKGTERLSKTLDSFLENLIRIFFTSNYARNVDLSNKQSSDETLDILTGKEASLSFNRYETTKALCGDAIVDLVESLDALYHGNQKIANYISKEYKRYYDEDSMFEKALHNTLTLPERLRFFAYVQYLIHYKKSLEGLDAWMRVIHNLTNAENTITDSNADFARGIKAIVNLLPHADHIISYLQTIHSIDGFSKHQGREECIKAHLMVRDDWKSVIEETEQHTYFNGQIGFLLEFAGVVSYDKDHEIEHLESEENAQILEAFKRYAKIVRFIFQLDSSKRQRINDKHYCFERAVLAHGMYMLTATRNRINMLSTETVVQNVKRDYSWKRLLRLGTDHWDKKMMVKSTMDDIEDDDHIIQSLEALCVPVNPRYWCNVLITSPQMFECCEYGFIYKDEDTIMLFGHHQMNHWHSELFTYHLWKDKMEDEQLNFPGFQKEYAWQKCTEVVPYILLSNFTYNRYRYNLWIDALLNETGDFDSFEISFGFNNQNKFDYPQEIEDLMDEFGFDNEYEDCNFVSHRCKTEGEAMDFVQRFVQELNIIKQNHKK